MWSLGLRHRLGALIAVVALSATLAISADAQAGADVAPYPVQVVAGSYSSCALLSDGTVRCWGWNAFGQLGDGTRTDRQRATPVVGLTGVKSLTAGDTHACALTAGQLLYCWGSNRFGQVGDGTVTDRLTPVNVTPAARKVKLVDAGTEHTCAATTANELYCWGGMFGEGLGTGGDDSAVVPTRVLAGPEPIYAFWAGHGNTCVQRSFYYACTGNNDWRMWGYPGQSSSTFAYQTGIDSEPRVMDSRSMHAQRTLGGSADADAHTCQLTRSTGVLQCAGTNNAGQLGVGTAGGGYFGFRQVPGRPFSALAVGARHTCAFQSVYREYRCWGWNASGQLGDGTTLDRSSPVRIAGLIAPDVPSIAASNLHTCAIARDTKGVTRVYCWGSDVVPVLGSTTNYPSGQLGNGVSVGSSRTPTRVLGI